jgi:hypothetical protein
LAFLLSSAFLIFAQNEIDCEKTMTRRVDEVKGLLKSCRMDIKAVINSSDFVFNSEVDLNMTEIYTDGNRNVMYLPTNIHEKFPNLLSLSIWNCGLKELSNATFRNLKFDVRIAINRNSLKTLELGTFDDCTALEFLFIDNNKIKKMSGNVFRSLTNLKKLDLSGNPCISENFDVANLKIICDEITVACFETPSRIEACENDLGIAKSQIETLTKSLKNKSNQCAKLGVV